MPNEISFEAFKASVNTRFDILLQEGTFPLTLVEATESTKNYREGFEVFSLLFKSDKTEGAGPFNQMTMPLRHEKHGDLHIFMTPVEAMEDGYLYEAVFNRKKIH